ncbi:MAG: VWA domain-containing protein [Bacteroidetes bacterium]|nr:VWA domain-containing protein [Bacteroidota bacterium]
MRIRFLLLIVGCSLLGGCKILQLFLNQGQTTPIPEPESVADAVPPAGYNPGFISGTAPDTGDVRAARLEVNSVFVVDTAHAQLAVHFIDGNGHHRTGAGWGERGRWCFVADSVNGQVRTLGDGEFKIGEENDSTPIALAMVLDHSGSMGPDRALMLQRAVNDLLRDKRPDDGIAVVRFDGAVETERPLRADRSAIAENGLAGFGGSTAIWNGVEQGLRELAAPIGANSFRRRAVVLFTDGSDNSSTVRMEDLIPMARSAGIQIFTVGFGLNIGMEDEDRLHRIATLTGGRYYKIYGRREFAPLFRDIYQRYRSYYLFALPLAARGLHTITLRLCDRPDSLIAHALVDNRPSERELAVAAPAYAPPPIAVRMPGRKSQAGPELPPVIVLDNVLFRKASAQWLPGAPEKLDVIARYMVGNTGLNATIEGYTSNTMGTPRPVLTKLSQDRARAVARYLVSRGIAAERLKAVGYGPDRPVALQRPDSVAARNRRVEVRFGSIQEQTNNR